MEALGLFTRILLMVMDAVSGWLRKALIKGNAGAHQSPGVRYGIALSRFQ